MSEPGGAREIFAVAPPGVEPLLEAELREMGIAGTAEPGGVAWKGPLEELYLASLCSRLATRVLVRVAEFRARTFFELERHARRIEWERYLAAGEPLHLRVSSRKSRLNHQRAIAQRLREAAELRLGPLPEAGESDEEGEPLAAGGLLVVRFLHDRCTLSVDASGEPLYRRGYRQALARAPLRENLAAALLRALEWTGAEPLLDPMCGSGTIPIEAALLARRIPPGLASPELRPRAFAFQRWPEHDPELWRRIVERERAGVLGSAPVEIRGSDRDEGAVEAALANAARAGVQADVRIERAPLSAAPIPETARGLLLTNPPYGVRVTGGPELRDLYAALGRLAAERLPGWTVALVSTDARLRGQLRLPLQERLRTRTGGISITLHAARAPGGR